MTISNHIHFVPPSFNISDSIERAVHLTVYGPGTRHTQRTGWSSIPVLVPVAKLLPAGYPVVVLSEASGIAS